MLRLLSRRRCLSCNDELPPTREYPMRVCAACILAPTAVTPRLPLPERVPAAPVDWREGDDGRDGRAGRAGRA